MKHITFTIGFCLALPSFLPAQDFYLGGVTADTSRRAGIYTPSAENPTDALSLNPAGLAALNAPSINLSITGIFARGSFSNASNNASPMATNNGFVPFGAFGSPLGKHWSMGVGVMPDLLSVSKWNYSDTPGFAGTTYGRQSEKSQINAIRSAAGIAYRFSDKFSAGASFGVDYNSNTLDAPYIFQSQPVVAGLKTLLNLHSTGWGPNGSFGIIAKPHKKLDLGVSYRTPTSITSHGGATGNLSAEFQSLGVNAPSAFTYKSQVHVELPPSALLAVGWQATSTVRLSFQTDWVGWHGAFNHLPVTLTQGTNAVVNSLLQSTTLKDTVPLDWKDQYTVRGSIERSFGENVVIGAGYLHGNDPVPNSTLSPLTAAIMQNGLSTGIGWHKGKLRFGASYGYDFTARQSVASSDLLYNEYSNSRTKIGTQAFTLTTAFTL
jgi:long-subunit fatty acid transport protein